MGGLFDSVNFFSYLCSVNLYTLIFKKLIMKKFLLFLTALVATATVAMAQDTWTVAGTAAILNGTDSWAPANDANDMTSTDGVNFTLSVENKTLETGVNYEFKVVKNHGWSEAYPSSNYILTVAETAVYTVNYSFNAETKDIAVETVKTGNAGEITHDYSVAGNNATLFGAEWNAENTTTDMTKGADGVFTWTSAETLLAVSTIQFKVVEDHSWGVSYGYNGDNATYDVTEAGKYVLKFSFNPDTKVVGCEVVSFTPEVVETNYFIKHNWGGEGAWSWKQLTKFEDDGDVAYFINDVYGGTGCNINTTDNDAGALWFENPENIGFVKVGEQCRFAYSPEENSVAVITLKTKIVELSIKDQEVELVEDQYNYTMTLTEAFDESDISVVAVNAKDAGLDFQIRNADMLESEDFLVEISLTKDSELIEKYTIVVTVDTSTGIKDLNVNNAKAVKMIENGQVVILKDGKKFNVAGQTIK